MGKEIPYRTAVVLVAVVAEAAAAVLVEYVCSSRERSPLSSSGSSGGRISASISISISIIKICVFISGKISP